MIGLSFAFLGLVKECAQHEGDTEQGQLYSLLRRLHSLESIMKGVSVALRSFVNETRRDVH